MTLFKQLNFSLLLEPKMTTSFVIRVLFIKMPSLLTSLTGTLAVAHQLLMVL